MSGRFVVLFGAVLAASLGAPPGAGAQERPVAVLKDSTTLVFEREQFDYPGYERRNPFRPLVTSEAGGPRFEDLKLLGILVHEDPARSVVLFGVGDVALADVKEESQVREMRARTGSAGFETYRLRRGDVIGNTRIVEIHEERVVVEIEEFGLSERRVLDLPRADEGGPS